MVSFSNPYGIGRGLFAGGDPRSTGPRALSAQDNPLLPLLEEDEQGRQAIFQGMLPGGLNPFQQRALSSLYQPTFTNFLGAMGRQILAGETPTLTFSDYLTQNFNPQRELLRMPSDRSRLVGSGVRYIR